MWTGSSISISTSVAVEAEKPEPRRKVIAEQPKPHIGLAYLPAVRPTVVVDVVDSQEKRFTLITALTSTPIVSKYLGTPAGPDLLPVVILLAAVPGGVGRLPVFVPLEMRDGVCPVARSCLAPAGPLWTVRCLALETGLPMAAIELIPRLEFLASPATLQWISAHRAILSPSP
jgi:hypothetical protein